MKFQHKGDRSIEDFSVGYVDGQCKVLCMLGVVAICHDLEFGTKELENEQLRMVLSSFTSIQCTFEHYNNPAQYFLQSLSTLSPINSSRFFQKGFDQTSNTSNILKLYHKHEIT